MFRLLTSSLATNICLIAQSVGHDGLLRDFDITSAFEVLQKLLA